MIVRHTMDLPAGPASETDSPPLGLFRSLVIAACLSLAMCWPMTTGAVFVFFDTGGYLAVGDRMISMVLPGASELSAPGGVPFPSAAEGANGGGAKFLRSFAYSLFISAAVLLGGALLMAVLQGAMTILTVLPLLPRAAFGRGVLPFALPAVLLLGMTTLPWFTVLAMPDIFAAAIIAYGAVLWRAFDRLGRAHAVLLVLVASFAATSHYGYPPLALALYGLVLLGRLAQGRLGLGIVLAAAIPVLISPVANLTLTSLAGSVSRSSSVTADIGAPSMAPRRLPILLARSIEDGPGAWYLAEACASGEDLAICKAFGGQVPDRINDFLWSDSGIKSLTQDEMQAVREEEMRIVLSAFLAYPLTQSAALAGNVADQAARAGLGQINALPAFGEPTLEAGPAVDLLSIFDRIMGWSTLAGALILVPMTFGRRDRIPVVLIVLVGLMSNAIIFGGLSAPVDRYQARAIWLLPALALGYAAADLALRRPATSRVSL